VCGWFDNTQQHLHDCKYPERGKYLGSDRQDFPANICDGRVSVEPRLDRSDHGIDVRDPMKQKVQTA
jgi:hypothetical protein